MREASASTSRPSVSDAPNRLLCLSWAGVTLKVPGVQSRVRPWNFSVNLPAYTKHRVGPGCVCHGRLLPAA